MLASPALIKGKGQGQCLPDSKLIGLTSLSTADEPGTWWHLTREGLDAAGITDYLGFIEQVFGRDFADLDEAIAFVVDRTAVADANGNGLVCAYDSRGTRANLGLPNVTLYTFTVLDDRLAD